jgi:hypothetical protein
VKKLLIAGIAGLVGIACVTLVYADLLVNPGFEIAEGGSGGVARTPSGWIAQNELGSEGWAAQGPSTNGVAFYAWNTGNWGNIRQETLVNLVNGNIFEFSINALAEVNYSSSANETWMKLEFWDASGSTRYYEVSNSLYSAMTSDPNNWNTSVGMVKSIFGGGNWVNDSLPNQSAFWDNAVLNQSVVPEPVSAILLGMGLSVIYFIRKRRS